MNGNENGAGAGNAGGGGYADNGYAGGGYADGSAGYAAPPAPPASENDARIARLEKKSKLILVLLIVVLALGAANLVFQFVSPFARGGMIRGGDFPNGQVPQNATQGQELPAADGQATQ